MMAVGSLFLRPGRQLLSSALESSMTGRKDSTHKKKSIDVGP